MNGDERVDALVAVLSRGRPVLDDLTRARVGARLDALIAAPAPAPRSAWLGRAFAVAGVAIASGAAAAATTVMVLGPSASAMAPALAIALRDAGPRDPAVAPQVGPDRAAATPIALRPEDRRAVAADTSVVVAIDTPPAAATVFGPGWIERDGSRLAIESAGAVIDVPTAGDFELVFRGSTIRATRATFGVDGKPVRVNVMRGEVTLDCDGRTLHARAGDTASCDAPVEPPAVPVARPPRPARAAGRAPRAALPGAALPVRARQLVEPPLAGPPAVAEPPVVAAPAPTAAAAAPTSAPSVDALYDRAERLMREGDAGAGAALERVIAEHADSPEAANALLDRARLALGGGAPREALRWLDRLDRRTDVDDLAEPATHMRCAALVAARDDAAVACFESYLQRFPGSPRAAGVVAQLVARHGQAGDCARVIALADAYLTRLPGALATRVRAWQLRCTDCGRDPARCTRAR